MNRPEPIELENNLGPDAVTGEINRVPWMAYDVDEMDIYIAEKDAEIAELKAENERLKEGKNDYKQFYQDAFKKIESLKASHYADVVDAGMRERRLRRALYKACANWADVVAFEETEGIGYDNSVAERWRKMESKCRAKAEEYK